MIVLHNFSRRAVKPLVVIDGEVRDAYSLNVLITVNDGELCKCPLVAGKFRAFVHLNQVDNVIRLRGDASESIRIETVTLEPIRLQRFVRLVYVVCRDRHGQFDGSFQAPNEEDASLTSALTRISIGALMMQYFYSETLSSRKTFRLELNDFHEPIVHVLSIDKSRDELYAMSQDELWQCVAKSLLTSYLADQNCKYLAFCSFTRYAFNSKKLIRQLKHKDFVQMTKGFVSLGGGGLALLGTHCLYTWPRSVPEIVHCLTDARPVDIRKFMNDSCGR